MEEGDVLSEENEVDAKVKNRAVKKERPELEIMREDKGRQLECAATEKEGEDEKGPEKNIDTKGQGLGRGNNAGRGMSEGFRGRTMKKYCHYWNKGWCRNQRCE